ncbi:hypothetical protein ACFL2F_05240, partial [Myxococcota bacterium]
MKREFFGSSVEEALEKAGLRYEVEAGSLEYTEVKGEFGRLLGSNTVAILVVEPERRKAKKPEYTPAEPAPEKKPGSSEWAGYVLE